MKKYFVLFFFVLVMLPVIIAVTAIVFIPFTGWHLLTGQDAMTPWLDCFDAIDTDPYFK